MPEALEENKDYLLCEELPMQSRGRSKRSRDLVRLSDQAVAKRKHDHCGPVVTGGLIEDVGQVMSDRFRAES